MIARGVYSRSLCTHILIYIINKAYIIIVVAVVNNNNN